MIDQRHRISDHPLPAGMSSSRSTGTPLFIRFPHILLQRHPAYPSPTTRSTSASRPNRRGTESSICTCITILIPVLQSTPVLYEGSVLIPRLEPREAVELATDQIEIPVAIEVRKIRRGHAIDIHVFPSCRTRSRIVRRTAVSPLVPEENIHPLSGPLFHRLRSHRRCPIRSRPSSRTMDQIHQAIPVVVPLLPLVRRVCRHHLIANSFPNGVQYQNCKKVFVVP